MKKKTVKKEEPTFTDMPSKKFFLLGGLAVVVLLIIAGEPYLAGKITGLIIMISIIVWIVNTVRKYADKPAEGKQ